MHAPKHIIVPFDFSDASTRALEYALTLAAPLGAPVVLFNALGPRPEDRADEVEAERLRRGALDEVRARYDGRGIDLGRVVRWGSPAEAIAEIADETRTDLVVMGTHGRRGAQRALLGSVAASTIRSALRPVLLVHAVDGAIPLAFTGLPKRLVVGMDFSPTAEHALDVALAFFARARHARVTLVHAWHAAALKALGEVVLPGVTFDSIGDCQARLDRIAKEHQQDDVTIDASATSGAPAAAIDGFATSVDAEMIVVGTHGRTGVRRLVMGSVAEALVRNATRPVMVVPGPEAHTLARSA